MVIGTRIGGFAAALSATLLLAACGGSTSSSETSASSGAGSEATSNSSAAASTGSTAASSAAASTGANCKAKGDPLRVVYIPKNLGNPYFDSIVKGFQDAGKNLNMTVDVVGPAQAGATDQLPFIDSAIQQKVDAIAISPNDPDAVVPNLKRAMDAGIKVIAVNSDMNPAGRQVAILPVDFTTLGAFLVKLTSDVTGGKGDFAVLSATSTAPDQNDWIKGMKASLAAGDAPGLNLVDVVFGDDQPDKSANEARALLTKYPNLAAINSPTTVGVAAAAQVLSGAPQKGKVQVTGLGTPNQMREYVKNGTVLKFALWDPAAEGTIAANLIEGLATCAITADAGTKFNVDGIGEREITDATQVITGPPVIFDKSNIDNYNF